MSNSITSSGNFKKYDYLFLELQMRYKLMILSLLLLLIACETDNHQMGTEYPNFANKIEGVVQKGPFINGTGIVVSELNSELAATGNNFQATIIDNIGSFSVKSVSLSSPYVSLRADGYFFNEITGQKTESQVTLFALADVTDKSTVNVNIISHLEKNRVDYLVSEGISFPEAKKQAAKDVLSMFYITDTISSSENLDITNSADENAILLAISVMLLGNQNVADFTEFLSDISTDIRTDGKLNSTTLFDEIVDNAKALNTEEIRLNIIKRYSDLGVSASIGNFEKYILHFINSSGTEKPIITLMTPEGGTNGLTQSFWAQAKTPYNSKIKYYRYDFDNDGIWDIVNSTEFTSISVKHSYIYPSYGEYSYTFQVEDEFGNITSQSNKITISGSVVYVKVNGNDKNNGASWETAFASPQTAYTYAQEHNVNQIWIAKGSYNNPQPVEIVTSYFFKRSPYLISIYGGFVGNEVSLNERDYSKNITILSKPDSLNNYAIVHVGENVTLDGFTIQDGSISNWDGMGHYRDIGSGVTNFGILRNCIIKDNFSSYKTVTSGPPLSYTIAATYNTNLIENCVISNQNGGNTLINKKKIINTTLSGKCHQIGEVNIDNCIIEDATIYAGNATISNCYVDTLSTIYLGNNLIGINDTIINCTIEGKIEIAYSSISYSQQCYLQLINNVFTSNNFANIVNVYQGFGDDKPEITYNMSLIHFNFVNNIIAVTLDSLTSECTDAFRLFNISHSISNVKIDTSLDSSITIIDALLGPLQDNGGPIQTMALLPGSPAIDAGTTEGAPATDARGVARDANPDIGAYEYE